MHTNVHGFKGKVLKTRAEKTVNTFLPKGVRHSQRGRAPIWPGPPRSPHVHGGKHECITK